MKIHRCDVCGVIIEKGVCHTGVSMKDFYSNRIEAELCNSCARKLYDFYKQMKKEICPTCGHSISE